MLLEGIVTVLLHLLHSPNSYTLLDVRAEAQTTVAPKLPSSTKLPAETG